jgi:dTDP-4-amino-4,6-dideoxygalactose transaminase
MITFNKPFIAGKELYYMAQAVLSGHISGNGAFTRKCESWMEEKFKVPRVLLTHSCTASLEMAALLADIQAGDEVILPSFTFVSTANAFVLRGAKLRFCEIRSDTLNMDETRIEELITDRTKVVVPVHYAGVACEMDSIMELARARGLLVVEDAAQGVNATYRGRYLGTMGHIGCYSFHETKNFICGEGGATLINDPKYLERAEIIREKGTNRSQFLKGMVDKYTWVDVGSSYLPSDLVAAFLFAQLEMAGKITEKRLTLYDYYWKGFEEMEKRGCLKRPYRSTCIHNGHMFYVLLPDMKTRDALMAHLKESGIQTVFHYIPLHSSPMGKRHALDSRELPVTDDTAGRILRLPCFYELTLTECDRVIQAVGEWFSCKA